MEDKTTAFLNMVMERLQTLEGRCDEQQDEIDALKSERSDMRARLLMDLHVVPEMYIEFSDGAVLDWTIGNPPQLMVDSHSEDPAESGTMLIPMDDQHLQATMYYGRKHVSMTITPAHLLELVVGQQGKRTTVAEFTDRVNDVAKTEGCSEYGRRLLAMNDVNFRLVLTTGVSADDLLT